MNLIDRFILEADFAERHVIPIRAEPALVEAAVQRLDLSQSWAVGALFKLRGLPRTALGMKGLEKLGFRILAHRPQEEIVLGLIGRFWKLRGGLVRFSPSDFNAFDAPGYAKAVW